jgi:C4-type Zn-finger protein
MFNTVPIKISTTFITEIEKIYTKVHSEIQKTMNSQVNTEQKEQHWRYHNTQFETILQSHSNETARYCTKTYVKTSGTE